MSGNLKRLAGPAYVGAAAANIYNPATNIIGVVFHIRLVNKDTVQRTVTLYVGATGGSAGGTEILKDWPIAVGGEKDVYFPKGLRMTASDFLTGIASAASAVTQMVMGDERAA